MLSAKGRKLHDLRLRDQGTNGNGIGIPAAPSIADVDRDGRLEIVVSTFDHGIDVYRVPRSNPKTPAVADRPRQPPAQRRQVASHGVYSLTRIFVWVNTLAHGPDRNSTRGRARWRIVELLAERPRSVGELAELTGLRQPQTTKHLQTLARAGLVTVFPLGQRRVYAIETAPLAALERRLRELVADHRGARGRA